MMIKIPQRAALASDINEVFGAPVQDEALVAPDFEHIPHGGALLDVAALRPSAPVFNA